MNNIEEKDELLPAELDTLPLEKETNEVLQNIVASKTVPELKSYTDMFCLNMAKKNAVRIAKLHNLLDKVNDQAIDRFENHPDECSNKEIIDYMKAVQDQITASQKTIDALNEKPMIQVNNQKNEVNINVDGGLSKESQERILEAINALVNQVKVNDDDVELYNIDEDVEESK